ncbi:MAG: 30S ribosome-binding factor RbfA [Firmicutes bacterium]|nr:30S ribosome-binding factor RbfA [Bacillota bacterium]
MSNYRPGRLGEEIKKILSDMLLRELKDPAFSRSLVSITAVDVTSDGSYATVYLTELPFGDQETAEVEKDERREQLLDAFARAKGMIRHELGKKIKVRHVPDLVFKIDTSMEYGRHIDEVIESLDIKKDEPEEDMAEGEDNDR